MIKEEFVFPNIIIQEINEEVSVVTCSGDCGCDAPVLRSPNGGGCSDACSDSCSDSCSDYCDGCGDYCSCDKYYTACSWYTGGSGCGYVCVDEDDCPSFCADFCPSD